MKKVILNFCLIIFGTSLFAQNGLDSIIIETYYISDANDAAGSIGTLPVGSVTYRIYADMKPGYKFQAVYGIPTHTMVLSTSTSFFNNEDRGATSPTYTKTQAKNNTVMLDSWLSVGAACSSQFGVLKAEDDGASTVINSDGILTNSVSAIGIPLTVEDGMIAGTPEAVTIVGISTEIAVFDATAGAGNLFTSDNGSWASLNGSVGPDSTNKILIAQITTDGEFCYELNIQIGTPSGGVENYVAENPSGNEVLLASLIGCVGGTNMLPSVSITSPSDGSIFQPGNMVAIDAMASDADGTVDSVEFFVDGAKIGVDVISPYQVNWLSATGTPTLTAIATDNEGGKDTSAAVVITVTTSVGMVDQATSEPLFIIYPNPAKDLISIEIISSKESAASYTIYSIQGNVLAFEKHKELGNIKNRHLDNLDITSLAKGQYIIVMSLDGVISTRKLIKN